VIGLVAVGTVVLLVVLGVAGREVVREMRLEQAASDAADVSGDYLPATDGNLIALLENEYERHVPDPSMVNITPYSSMPDVPSSDAFGNRTESNADHWFAVEFCDGGGTEFWDVNPYAEQAFQDGFGFGC
jgi:hypothetical protein